jgi:hypothetical protein
MTTTETCPFCGSYLEKDDSFTGSYMFHQRQLRVNDMGLRLRCKNSETCSYTWGNNLIFKAIKQSCSNQNCYYLFDYPFEMTRAQIFVNIEDDLRFVELGAHIEVHQYKETITNNWDWVRIDDIPQYERPTPQDFAMQVKEYLDLLLFQ